MWRLRVERLITRDAALAAGGGGYVTMGRGDLCRQVVDCDGEGFFCSEEGVLGALLGDPKQRKPLVVACNFGEYGARFGPFQCLREVSKVSYLLLEVLDSLRKAGRDTHVCFPRVTVNRM